MSRRRDSNHFYFQGFANPNTTPVPDVVFDEFLSVLGEAELKALLYIIRRTFGFKKDRDPISSNQFLRGIITRDGRVLDRGCGISDRTTLSRALKSLEEKGIIQSDKGKDERGENETTVYHLRFRDEAPKGVVGNSYHPGMEPPPPVVGNSYPQQTVIQDTARQHNAGVASRTSKQKFSTVSANQEHHAEDLAVPVTGVAQVLHEFGISPRVAAHLAATYPEAHILAKLDFVQWLVETSSPLVGRNPAGYLRRAIEDDYTPPPTYKSPAQRQADAEHREQVNREEQARRRQAEEAYQHAKELNQQQLAAQYPPQPIPSTDLTTTEAWEQTLAALKTQVTGPIFHTWLRPARLISCDGQQAVIAATSRYHSEELRTRLSLHIAHTLGTVIGAPVTCAYVPLSELVGQNGTGPQPPTPAG